MAYVKVIVNAVSDWREDNARIDSIHNSYGCRGARAMIARERADKLESDNFNNANFPCSVGVRLDDSISVDDSQFDDAVREEVLWVLNNDLLKHHCYKAANIELVIDYID